MSTGWISRAAVTGAVLQALAAAPAPSWAAFTLPELDLSKVSCTLTRPDLCRTCCCPGKGPTTNECRVQPNIPRVTERCVPEVASQTQREVVIRFKIVKDPKTGEALDPSRPIQTGNGVALSQARIDDTGEFQLVSLRGSQQGKKGKFANAISLKLPVIGGRSKYVPYKALID